MDLLIALVFLVAFVLSHGSYRESLRQEEITERAREVQRKERNK